MSSSGAITAAGPLRVALLGCGYAARLNAPALVAVGARFRPASRERSRAEELSSRFGGGSAFGSYEEAVASPEVDAIAVLTPPPSHLEWTLRALAAGKHVIVEKPPFLKASDFDQVEKAATRTGRRVVVAENYFYKPLVRSLREIVTSGEIGEVRFVLVNALKQQAVSGWRADEAQVGGGALYEGGIHWVSFMGALGLSVRSARAVGPRRRGGPEREVLAAFEYEEGAAGALAHSWVQPSPLQGLRVSRLFGTEGSVAFESNGLWVAVWGRRKRVFLPGLLQDLTGRKAMWTDFVASLREGREPEMSLARARRDLELVESIEASLPSETPNGRKKE